MEECFWSALTVIRDTLAADEATVTAMAEQLVSARERLTRRGRKPRDGAPRVETLYEIATDADETPEDLICAPGSSTTLRGVLGKVLDHYNRASDGAVFAAAADLLGSTSVLSAQAASAELGLISTARRSTWTARSRCLLIDSV